MILNFNGTGAVRRPQEVTNLTNFFYYVILLPFGVVGNALSLVVSIYLLRGTERRFSADIYCAFLAITGLLCIACIHVVTVFLLLSNDVSNVPAELCRFAILGCSLAICMYIYPRYDFIHGTSLVRQYFRKLYGYCIV